jgi:hypothetical protein
MRRLALAAVLGILVVTACSDQSKQAPTEPDVRPSFAIDLTLEECADPVWLAEQKALAAGIFPGGKGKTLLSSANEKLTEIYNFCNRNKQAAVTRAIVFDDWMFKKFQTKLLTTNSNLGPDVLSLFINVLNGVGINTSTVTPDLVTGDAGTGVFLCDPLCPTTPTTVLTTFSFAGLQVPGDGFSETTLLIIGKLPDNTRLKSAQGRSQFPPFYDFNALNASNQHVLNTGKLAHVEMCLYFDITYPADIAVGHNPVSGAPGYPFEVLPPGEFILLQGCQADGGISSVNPGGLQGMAVSAWRAAKRGMTAVFLPQTLRAATLAVIGTGSKSGSAGSLSPFGLVGAANLDFTQTGNPTGQSFTENSTLSWCFETKGCSIVYPSVRLIDAQGEGIGDVPITVTLIPVGESAGTFVTDGEGGGSTTTVSTSTGEGAGFAQFDNLQITEPGTYMLRFSAPGKVAPLTSGEFAVEQND